MPSLEINGQQVELRCGLREHEALCEFTGKNLLAGENPVTEITFANLANFLHILIQGKFTVDEIKDSITSTKHVIQAIEMVGEAISKDVEAAVKAEENPSKAA